MSNPSNPLATVTIANIDRRTLDIASEALRREMIYQGHPDLWMVEPDTDDIFINGYAKKHALNPYTLKAWEAYVILSRVVL